MPDHTTITHVPLDSSLPIFFVSIPVWNLHKVALATEEYQGLLCRVAMMPPTGWDSALCPARSGWGRVSVGGC